MTSVTVKLKISDDFFDYAKFPLEEIHHFFIPECFSSQQINRILKAQYWPPQYPPKLTGRYQNGILRPRSNLPDSNN